MNPSKFGKNTASNTSNLSNKSNNSNLSNGLKAMNTVEFFNEFGLNNQNYLSDYNIQDSDSDSNSD